MSADLEPIFDTLKPLLAEYANGMRIQCDTRAEYTLVTRSPSPFHKGKDQPLHFGSVKLGKAYVSYHLMPLYMCEELKNRISPALQKRMQGKSCFNFKKPPEPELLDDLRQLTEAGHREWADKNWL